MASGVIHYEGLDQPETEVWGPSALRSSPDGDLWLVDSAGGQLVRLSAAGVHRETIAIGDHVVGAVDVLVRERELWVLDMGANTPRIVRLTRAGRWIDTTPLPEALLSHVDGFFERADGRVLLQVEGVLGCELQLDGVQLTYCVKPTPLTNGVKPITVEMPDAPTEEEIGHTLVLQAGDATTRVDFTHFVSSVRVLRATPDGELFISLEEVTFDPVVIADATVLHIDAQGKIVERARVPVDDQLVYVRHAVALDADGRAFALITDRDGADLVELEYKETLEPVLPGLIERARRERATASSAPAPIDATPDTEVAVTKQALEPCRTTTEMNDTGFAYINNATWLSTTNLDRAGTACPTRLLPRYFATAAESKRVNADAVCGTTSPGAGYECVRSVPYDWGGYDTLATYRSQIGRGNQSGDADSRLALADRTLEACSRGVDCSGFVTRLWDIPTFYPKVARVVASSLPNYSSSVSAGALRHPTEESAILQRGDILLNVKSHVTMFRRFGDATVSGTSGRFPFHFEATTTSGFDRAIYWYWAWSRFNQFEPRRFLHVCD